MNHTSSASLVKVSSPLLSKFEAPAGMRIDGHLWTTGDRIYGRYLRAHLPGGRTVPICLELVDGSEALGLPKEEGSKPDHTVGDKVSSTWAAKRWR